MFEVLALKERLILGSMDSGFSWRRQWRIFTSMKQNWQTVLLTHSK